MATRKKDPELHVDDILADEETLREQLRKLDRERLLVIYHAAQAEHVSR